MSGFPTGTPDELELFLRWLAFPRGAVLRAETARHAGHADAVRELLDGTTGE